MFCICTLPDWVQNIPILKYSQQLVISCDFVKVGSLLIGKKQIWFPYGVQHGRVQVQRVVWVFSVGESGIVPLLTKEDVHAIVLLKWEVKNNWSEERIIHWSLLNTMGQLLKESNIMLFSCKSKRIPVNVKV